jgi:hypothetical protein
LWHFRAPESRSSRSSRQPAKMPQSANLSPLGPARLLGEKVGQALDRPPRGSAVRLNRREDACRERWRSMARGPRASDHLQCCPRVHCIALLCAFAL